MANEKTKPNQNTWHKGQCHCGTVRFEVLAPSEVEITKCNCSICNMTGFLHLIVGADDFRLITGAKQLTTYTFNTRTAKHMFCQICGVKPFYRPRSHPNGWSVNFNCIDTDGFEHVTLTDFDGQNWEDNIKGLLSS